MVDPLARAAIVALASAIQRHEVAREPLAPAMTKVLEIIGQDARGAFAEPGEQDGALSLDLLRARLMEHVPLGDVRTVLDTRNPIAAACLVILLDEVVALRQRVAALEDLRDA